ncbi:unnamed protein product [Caenorhabditis brenneri]
MLPATSSNQLEPIYHLDITPRARESKKITIPGTEWFHNMPFIGWLLPMDDSLFPVEPCPPSLDIEIADPNKRNTKVIADQFYAWAETSRINLTLFTRFISNISERSKYLKNPKPWENHNKCGHRVWTRIYNWLKLDENDRKEILKCSIETGMEAFHKADRTADQTLEYDKIKLELYIFQGDFDDADTEEIMMNINTHADKRRMKHRKLNDREKKFLDTIKGYCESRYRPTVETLFFIAQTMRIKFTKIEGFYQNMQTASKK